MTDPAATWHRHEARTGVTLLLGLAALAGCFAVDIATGPAMLPLGAVIRTLAGLSADPMVNAIVQGLRLPIALIALLVGAALGVSGAVMQTVLNNPLASSYTLGISAGAGFGAALAILLGASLPVPEDWAVPLSAFAFAGLACALVAAVGQMRGATPELLVLAGMACLFLFQALQSLLQFLASPEALQQIVFWLFGSLSRATLPKAAIVAAVLLLVLPMVFADAWRLTALQLGDERAQSLGVRVHRLRLRSLIAVSLLTGAAVAFVGTIGFIGLVAPHVARMLVGADQRRMLPAAALFGALLLSAASIASKLVMPGTLFPIGIITALIGVPFFVWLLLSNGRLR
ncbi:iron ABC transporter permease [Acidisphaera sp. L21]|uniref:FecCD family ABC transporter permease n=1 Tax=Acidisphaera sp. L21 TaxID=1641851 RepID=UPI00131D526C|nr:iron ABC transporter permease [Acidisphaera sp. L21]